jgi:hypothetical protein
MKHAIAAAGWSLATSATTAFVSSLARTLCMQPYWPGGYLLQCRPFNWKALLNHGVLESVVTTIMVVLPTLIIGVAMQVLLVILQRFGVVRNGPLIAAAAGGVMFALLIRRLEPSYLDFIISWYAVAIGAMAGGLLYLKIHKSKTVSTM